MDEKEIAQTARGWMSDRYDAYPQGIEGFSSRDFSSIPTVVLSEKVDPDILESVIQEQGYLTDRRRSQGGISLVAACERGPDNDKEVIYTFEATQEIGLDDPRKNKTPPEDGRIEIIIEYLKTVY